MSKIDAIISVLLLSSLPATIKGAGRPASDPITQADAIFVARIEDAKPPACDFGRPRGDPPICLLPVHAIVTRVLKEPRPALARGVFAANLKQMLSSGSDRPWSIWDGQQVGLGQQYLVFCNRTTNPKEALETPDYLELLTGESDSVADVETILETAPLPMAAKVEAMTVAVGLEGARHGPLFAANVFGMLTSGSPSEVGSLSRALIGSPDTAFSDSGRRSLLQMLNRIAPQGAVDMVGLFVALTLKYFPVGGEAFEPGKRLSKPCTLMDLANNEGCGASSPGTYTAGPHAVADWTGLTSTQRAILDWHLPWIRGNERALDLLRSLPSLLDGDKVDKLRRLAATISSDPGQSDARRAEALRLQSLLK